MTVEASASNGQRADVNAAHLTSYLFAVLAPALWAGNFVVARAMHAHLSPLTLNLFRWISAMLVLAPIFGRSAWDRRAELVRSLRPLLMLAITGVVGFNSVLYIAVHYTSAISASVLFAITPFFICLINSFIARRSPTLIQMLAVVLSVIGAIIVLGVHLDTFSVWQNGDLLVLVASLIWATYCIAIKRSNIKAGGGPILLSCAILGVIIQLPLSLVEIVMTGMPRIDVNNLVAVLYLGIGAAALGFLVWQRAIHGLGPEKCGVFLNLIPVFGSVLAMIFLHERLSPHLVVGAFVVACALVIAQFARKAHN